MNVFPVCVNDGELFRILKRIGVSSRAFDIFQAKSEIIPLYVRGLTPPMASIVKQEALSSKGDAAVHAHVITCGVEKSDVLILCTPRMYKELSAKLIAQGYPTLTELSSLLMQRLDTAGQIREQVTPRGKKLSYGKPLVMGILNMTDDSFYAGSRLDSAEQALSKARTMAAEGATIIDIGGESTRPGSSGVSADIEAQRIIPALEMIAAQLDTVISVDTTKAEVARQALAAGADIINDVSGLTDDPGMAALAAQSGAVCVVMHRKGTPRDMQKAPEYENVTAEIVDYFTQRIVALEKAGICNKQLVLDPGIGFGKTLEHNAEIIKNIPAFRSLGQPVMVGASRKMMTGALLSGSPDKPSPPDARLTATLAVHVRAVMGGADIIRVHDVKEHAEFLRVFKSI